MLNQNTWIPRKRYPTLNLVHPVAPIIIIIPLPFLPVIHLHLETLQKCQKHWRLELLYLETLKHCVDLTDTLPGVVPVKLLALCRLIGPGGVRVLDTEMIRRSLHCLKKIKTSILANMLVIDKGLDVSSSAA